MYISHKYKTVFLRSPKTASSSLSEYLIRNIPDPDAVYTPVEDAKIAGTLDQSIINKYKRNFKYYHFTLQELVNEKIITEEQAQSYYVFSVLREPLDRQKSFLYFYARWKARGKPVTLNHFKEWAPHGYFNGEPNSAMLQTDFLKLNGQIAGRFWLYEDISKNLDKLFTILNIKPTHDMPRHKSDFRKNRENEIEFDQETISKIRSFFWNDFEMYRQMRLERNG